jgi:hypothetical protein
VEAVLAGHFGRPVPLRLVVDGEAAPPPKPVASPVVEEPVDMSELTDAPSAPTSSIDRITEAFPGAELLTDES